MIICHTHPVKKKVISETGLPQLVYLVFPLPCVFFPFCFFLLEKVDLIKAPWEGIITRGWRSRSLLLSRAACSPSPWWNCQETTRLNLPSFQKTLHIWNKSDDGISPLNNKNQQTNYLCHFFEVFLSLYNFEILRL